MWGGPALKRSAVGLAEPPRFFQLPGFVPRLPLGCAVVFKQDRLGNTLASVSRLFAEL
jgi:hypothetical protein